MTKMTQRKRALLAEIEKYPPLPIYQLARQINRNYRRVFDHVKELAGAGLVNIRQTFSKLDDWQAEAIHEVIIAKAEEMGLKLGKVAQPIRVAVTGGTVSPPIDITLQLLGRDITLERLQRAIEACGS